MLRLAPLLLVALVSPVRSADAARPGQRARPKSHHLRRARPAAPEQPQAAPIERTLGPGRWSPEARDSLDRMIQERGSGAEGYSAAAPPVAVFVWEGVAAFQSLGNALFQRLVREAGFKFGPEFWKLFPAQCGRNRARAAYEGFRSQPRPAWDKDPYYAIYRKTFLRAFRSICRTWGEDRCVRWREQLWAGFEEDEVRRYARAVLAEELRRPVGVESVPEYAGDPDPAQEITGLRRVPEMEDLFAKLRARGFDVWVLCSANQMAAEEFAKEYGVHTSRVVGFRAKLAAERLSADLLVPAPAGPGNEEAVAMFIGRSPALIVGGEGDAGLLSYGRGVRIMVMDPDKAKAAPRSRTWLVQPRMSPSREPQERIAEGAAALAE
jgi:phosphoglycolate phosphatase-like HAD superfamily hydrolase